MYLHIGLISLLLSAFRKHQKSSGLIQPDSYFTTIVPDSPLLCSAIVRVQSVFLRDLVHTALQPERLQLLLAADHGIFPEMPVPAVPESRDLLPVADAAAKNRNLILFVIFRFWLCLFFSGKQASHRLSLDSTISSLPLRNETSAHSDSI